MGPFAADLPLFPTTVHLDLDYNSMLASSEASPGAFPTWIPALVQAEGGASGAPSPPRAGVSHSFQRWSSSGGMAKWATAVEHDDAAQSECMPTLSPGAVARTLDVVTTAALWRESDAEPAPKNGPLPPPPKNGPLPPSQRQLHLSTCEDQEMAIESDDSDGEEDGSVTSNSGDPEDGCLDLDLVLSLHLARASSAAAGE